MNIDQLCVYLNNIGINYTKHNIRKLIEKKQIPYYKPAGRILFRKDEIDGWLELSKQS